MKTIRWINYFLVNYLARDLDLFQKYVHDLSVLNIVVMALSRQFEDYLESCEFNFLRHMALLLEYLYNYLFDL